MVKRVVLHPLTVMYALGALPTVAVLVLVSVGIIAPAKDECPEPGVTCHILSTWGSRADSPIPFMTPTTTTAQGSLLP